MTADIFIRKLRDEDSLDDLTKLLHRSYKILADMGLKYVATYQKVDITRKRLANGTCFVAEREGEIVGTILYRKPGQPRGCPFYQQPGVAHISQMGVEPELQRQGIGARLIEYVVQRAVADGATELALDTSEGATHLIRWYEKLGFRFIDYVDWDVTNYRSVIMSKRL